MKQGKISVIVPVYNVENYLRRCIDSLLNQTYRNLEIILVNDGSTDTSLQICNEYAQKDARITVINKPNGGLSSARNAGLDAATGDYIGFVDSDDYVGVEMYERLLAAIPDDTSISNVMFVRAFEDGRLEKSAVPHTANTDISAKDYLRELLMHKGDVSACTKLFPKKLIADTRFEEGVLNEDLLFMTSLIGRISGIRFIGFVGYYYFVRGGSISSGYGKAVVDMVQNSIVVKARALNLFPELKQEAERFALYQHMAYLLLIPKEKTKNNQTYKAAKKYIHKHFWCNLGNPYLKKKNKFTLFLQLFIPKICAKKYQKKHFGK